MILKHKNTTEQTEYESMAGLSALDVFLARVYKFVVLSPTSVAAFSAILYTINKINGKYPDVEWPWLIAFDITNLFYFLMALHFFRAGLKGDHLVKQKKLKHHKVAVGIIILIQYNFTIYLIPYDQWWAYAPFFIIFTVFFFDMKLTSWVTAGMMASVYLSWFIRPDFRVPPGIHQFSDFVGRICYLNLSAFMLLSLTHLGSKYLIDELEKYANYDTHTHLLNRKSMDGYLREAHQKARNGKNPFCLMMVDIDDFKKVNDTYGHDCGDEVLKYVAHTIMSGVMKNDYVFRWGGEEICILMKTDVEHAVAAAERIRKDIEHDTIRYRDEVEVSVTVTIGISGYKELSSIQDIMDSADAKLYWGKRHGKNQVVSVIPD